MRFDPISLVTDARDSSHKYLMVKGDYGSYFIVNLIFFISRQQFCPLLVLLFIPPNVSENLVLY